MARKKQDSGEMSAQAIESRLAEMEAERKRLEAALKQALRNLMDNARKFTPPGGSVSWRVWRAGPNIRLEVSDTGVGIPADELDQIFEPYYRASSGKGAVGSGLGLSIVRDVVSAHRGKIEVVSTPGEGSTFTVTLVAVPPSR